MQQYAATAAEDDPAILDTVERSHQLNCCGLECGPCLVQEASMRQETLEASALVRQQAERARAMATKQLCRGPEARAAWVGATALL